MKRKINWRVYERDHIYPQSLVAYLELLKLIPSSKHPYLAEHYGVFSFIGDYFWWARDADKLERAARGWINQWVQNKKQFQQFIKQFKKSHDEVTHDLPALKKGIKKTKGLSDQELHKIYQRTREIFLDNLIVSEYTVDVFDDFFIQIFIEHIDKISKQEINSADLHDLMQPAKPSKILLYRKRLLELSLQKKVSISDYITTANQFSWIMMSWDGSNELTPTRVKHEIKALKKKSARLRKKELNEINKYTQSVKRQRKIITKQKKLAFKKLTPYFRLLDTFTVLHDWRKEAQMRCCQIIFRALKEIAKRCHIRFYDLLWYFNPEIKRLFIKRKEISKKVIKKRQTGLTWVVRRGKISQYQGKKAKQILERLVLSVQRAKQVSKVSGIPASRGQVRGKAYIVKSAKEAIKLIKQGGILVTSMTTVDYLPAMRKAAAIVTDDGGLTCHAAIVSRELKIPCVVGTKISTQVFKNGNKIEVNASKGVVKKL